MVAAAETVPSAARVELATTHIGITGTRKLEKQAVDEANRLLQKNHEEWHMFFRDRAGHNHIAHSILTCLALGASTEDIQRAYSDGVEIQRPMPGIDTEMVQKLSDDQFMYETIGEIAHYTTFLAFFTNHMAEHGWKATIQKYLFSRTKVAEKMLAHMFEGAYHPVIHFGLGIEFQQPSIIAEGLAQAAAHDDSAIDKLFEACEAQAAVAYPSSSPKPLIQLVHDVRNNDTIRNAPQWTDFYHRMRDGVIGRALVDMASVGAQFTIKPDDLERRTAEMISTCAFIAGASQRPGRKRKIDFFYMHLVTSSLFFSVIIKQDWIKLEDRVRMVEWKGRLDLAWYAVSGSAELHADAITDYHDDASVNMGWKELFAAVNKEHDDGHVAKLIRALKNGEQVAKPFESGQFSGSFPVHGDMWLKVGRMVWDTTKGLTPDLKWVHSTGFDMSWKNRLDLA